MVAVDRHLEDMHAESGHHLKGKTARTESKTESCIQEKNTLAQYHRTFIQDNLCKVKVGE